MSFEQFKQFILEYASPLGIRVKFNHTNGRYYANCDDGSTIVGNPRTNEVWGITFNGTKVRKEESTSAGLNRRAG